MVKNHSIFIISVTIIIGRDILLYFRLLLQPESLELLNLLLSSY